MHSDWVGAIRRACREDSGERVRGMVTRVSLESGAIGEMEPSENENLCAGVDPVERLAKFWRNLHPGIRGTFVPLSRSLVAICELRLNNSNGVNCIGIGLSHNFLIPFPSSVGSIGQQEGYLDRCTPTGSGALRQDRIILRLANTEIGSVTGE